MLEILQFVFTDFTHYIGTMGLMIVTSMAVHLAIEPFTIALGRALKRPKTLHYNLDGQTILKKELGDGQ